MNQPGFHLQHLMGRFDLRAKILAVLFIVYGSIAVPLICFLMPPFQAADEVAHAQRASDISFGGFIATRFDGAMSSGGTIDLGIDHLWFLFEGLRFHPERKVSRAMMEQAAAIGSGPMEKRSFANTAIYPPSLYLPSALGQLCGRMMNLSPLHALLLSRLLNGFASIMIAAVAIAFSDSFAPFIFALMCLPMTLALFASVSQDGPMIALSALAVALAARAANNRSLRNLWVVSITLVAMARPAYLPLCAIGSLFQGISRRRRILDTVIPMGAVLTWSGLTNWITLYRPSATQVAAQTHFLLHHPAMIPTIVRTTLRAQFFPRCESCRQFIGVLGWLDTALPEHYYMLTGFMVAVAGLLSMPTARTLPAVNRFAVAALIGASVCAVFFLQYLSWSPVGSPVVEGIQGRYFLPVAPFVVLVLPNFTNSTFEKVHTAGLFAIASYPALSILVTVCAIVFRYYR